MKNKKLNFIILLIFTVLVLYFSLRNNFTIVMSYILKMNYVWFFLSVLLMVMYWVFKALITFNYVKSYKKDYKFLKAFRLQLETMFFNGVTPFSSGGGPFQILSLKKDGVGFSKSANVMVISSFLHQTSLATFMLISVIANRFLNLFTKSITIRNLSIFGFIICIIVMIFLLLVMFNNKFNKFAVNLFIKLFNKIHIIKNKDAVISKWDNYLDNIHEGSKIIKADKQKFIKCYTYNLLAMLAYVMTPYTIAKGMNIDLATHQVIIATSYTLMIGMFVPIPGGTGGLEFAFANLFSNFIVGSYISSVMLVWRFITYYLGIILGGIVLNFKRRSS